MPRFVLVAVPHLFQFGAPVECGFGRDLRQASAPKSRGSAAAARPARTSAGGTTIQPMRQPVMQKYLENELMMMASGDSRAAHSAAKA